MRALPMDIIPGPVALIIMPLSAADVFTTEQISDDVVAPDVVIDEDLFSSAGNLQIQEILAWDVTRIQLEQSTAPLAVGSENDTTQWQAGIVRDNAVTAVPPTSNVETQHTRPGANDSSASSRFVEKWYARITNEEQASPANVTLGDNGDWHYQQTVYERLINKTNMDVSELVMLDAHYHFWGDSILQTANVCSWSMGMRARRISADFLELMFDRQTLLGILNAVGQVF